MVAAMCEGGDACAARGTPNAECVNVPGGFLCLCRAGYKNVSVVGAEHTCEGEFAWTCVV